MKFALIVYKNWWHQPKKTPGHNPGRRVIDGWYLFGFIPIYTRLVNPDIARN